MTKKEIKRFLSNYEVQTLPNHPEEPHVIFRTKEQLLRDYRLETISVYLRDINEKKYEDIREWVKYHSNISGEDADKLPNEILVDMWENAIKQLKEFTDKQFQRLYERDNNVSLDFIYDHCGYVSKPISKLMEDIEYYQQILNDAK